MAEPGLRLDCPAEYQHASLRFFDSGEHHVTRYCAHDVLLLVYEGVLRFSENGVPVEVAAGEYYIQHHDMHQGGEEASDAPKYLYVHFLGRWGEEGAILPRRGTFSYRVLEGQIRRMDDLSHSGAPYLTCAGVFYELLSALCREPERNTPGSRLLDYLTAEYLNISSLEALCEKFHYSRNHIVNLCKAECGETPVVYLNHQKLRRAMYLLETTSKSADAIARESGFHDYSHFYRLFLRKTGLTPMEWRRQQRIAPR